MWAQLLHGLDVKRRVSFWDSQGVRAGRRRLIERATDPGIGTQQEATTPRTTARSPGGPAGRAGAARPGAGRLPRRTAVGVGPPHRQLRARRLPLPAGRCRRSVDCGYLTVPERRDRPTDRRIQLAVAVCHSPSSHPRPDPVLVLGGGPGGQQLGYGGPMPSGATRDVVPFDQRRRAVPVGAGLRGPIPDRRRRVPGPVDRRRRRPGRLHDQGERRRCRRSVAGAGLPRGRPARHVVRLAVGTDRAAGPPAGRPQRHPGLAPAAAGHGPARWARVGRPGVSQVVCRLRCRRPLPGRLSRPRPVPWPRQRTD
jgi:hypothetical protein